MDKQQIVSHCKIVLTHKYKSTIDGSTIIKIVDTFYKEDDPQVSISQALKHYQLMLEGLWKLPVEASTEVKQKSMFRDWTRTW
jgi:hypothetical protein